MSQTPPLSIDTSQYHIWTDALHARELARRSKDKWNRGSYVRWAIMSAWMAFECALEALFGKSDLGHRFPERLNEVLAKKSIARMSCGSGVWQRVKRVYGLRKNYVHAGLPQEDLFAESAAEAESAVNVLREGIMEAFRVAGRDTPAWVLADRDLCVSSGVFFTAEAHATVVKAGARPEDAVRVCYVRKGKEYEHVVLPKGSDPQPEVERLEQGISVPITAIRVYHGLELVEERTIRMRGG